MGSFQWKDTNDDRIKMLGDIYYARFSLKGERVQQSLRVKNFKVAVQLVDDIQKSILLGADWRRDKKMFDELWPEFIKAKATGNVRGIKKVRDRTLRDYISHGETWYLPFFGEIRVDKIDAEKWEEYMQHVRKTSRAGEASVMLNHWKYLSSFFRWAVIAKHLTVAPYIYNPDKTGDDEEETVGRSYTDEELRKLRDGAKGAMKVWIVMAQYMGMRSTEITALRKDRVDTAKWIIRLKKADTKTATRRLVPIHQEVRDLLVDQMSRHPDSEFVFPNRDNPKEPMDRAGFQTSWTELRTAVGVQGRFHDFRVSYATRVFAIPGLNPVVICSSLGMSLKVALKHYIKFDESQLNEVAANFTLEGK